MNRKLSFVVLFALVLVTAASTVFAGNTYPWPNRGAIGIGTEDPLELLHVTGSKNDLLLHSGGSQAIFANAEWNSRARREEYTRDMAFAQRIGFYNYEGGGIGLHVADRGSRGQRVDWKDALFLKDNMNVGLGTRTPLERLHIHGSENDLLLIVGGSQGMSGNADWDSPSQSWLYTRSGARAHKVGFYNGSGDGPVYEVSVAPRGTAGTAIEWNHAFTIDNAGRVGIGTRNPTHELAVDGTILAREVLVSVEAQNWPDYVFDEDYDLHSLDEVEDYIAEHKHLPGVPSSETVGAEGVELGEMNRVMMEKIEELTLHLIDLKNENRDLARRITEMQGD